ncbi:MAG: helix-turn-helix transcriptional regulator, partial [Clostridia bacterium]|nr:helix-turn-helix transcriptional regulator [Clostridia bacterium]
IENGTRCMSLETLVSVANALGVTADALLCDSLDNQLNACVAELEYILKDCTNYERRLLLDAVRGLKQSLKDNYYLKK